MGPQNQGDAESLLDPKQSFNTVDKASKIKEVFADLNRKFEEQETQRHARAWQMPYFDLSALPIEQNVLATLPLEQAQATTLIPFFREGTLLRVGVVEPHHPLLQTVLENLRSKKYDVELYLISYSSFLQALEQYHKVVSHVTVERHEISITSNRAVLDRLQSLPKSNIDLRTISATEYLGMMVGSAILLRATDIHLEPEKTDLKVRFRIDGVLHDIVILPKNLFRVILTRIKLLAGLKLNIVAKPQEGHFRGKHENQEIDLRVAIIPSAFGESITMRLLGQDQGVEFLIEKLGLRGGQREMVYKGLKKPHGMVLTTGPTGAGKTTTLYTFLKYLNKPGVKIVTLEDPIEYELEGIVQTPIDRAAGLDFAKSLPIILRQDPDIVMVGEIRDFETAETASQGALTGHLVLSTMHTNDAAGAIPRLLDLGVKPVTLAPALHMLIAQRLLRRICQTCHEVYKPGHEELVRVRQILENLPPADRPDLSAPLVFYTSKGCPECNNLGYRGRIGSFEILVVTDKIQELTYKQASTQEIKREALAAGMVTIQQNAILTALDGVTDLAEIWRVTEE